jgi:hypothetical protein
LIGVIVLKFHIAADMVTAEPGVMAKTLGVANTPEAAPTIGAIQEVTAVAVADESES